MVGLDAQTVKVQALLDACMGVSVISGVPMTALLHAWGGLINANDSSGSPRESLHDRNAAGSHTLTSQSGLMPTADRFWAFAALIERDNSSLYNKLRNLD